ncbi:Levodione reductase [Elsinoe australis]|uniref:Levodione reductase n=1 Tax=Elsinoe australis TaxID=40998 RepID=A0A2P7ZQC7_9PEZI|nr:Levodione reductase [Elsinoe australis]
MSFSGKTAIVTGGCGGLGAAITTAFLDAGANVVAVDINADLIKSFGEANNKSTLLTHQADISDEAALNKLFSEAISKFGQVDILINNAGIMDRFEPVGELDKSYWDRVLNVNLTAPYMTSKRLANHVQEKGHKGAIVNVSSLAGTTGWAAGAAYTASKWGLIGLTKNIAAFYADKNVRCNAIMPGPMQTGIANHFAEGYSQAGMAMQQKKSAAMGPPSELADVAALILYLSGDSAKTISGSCVPIDSAWGAV